jgi:hypothetical protein
VPVISSFLPSGVEVGAIDMLGTLRRPDGSSAILHDPRGVVLEVPDEPGRMVSPRTAIFILDPLDVSIGVSAIAVPAP